MAKPGGALILDTGHALVRNPRICLAFNEGSGVSRDLVRPQYPIFARGTPTWTSNADGACVLFGDTDGYDFYQESDRVSLPSRDIVRSDLAIDACTFFLVRRKTDLVVRTSRTFGVYDFGSENQLGCNAPFSDGNIYWDYGGSTGANRLVWPGYVPSMNLEKWVFVAGPSGMAIYQDSGTAKVSHTTPVHRGWNGPYFDSNGNQLGGPNFAEFCLNALHVGPGGVVAINGDRQEIGFFGCFATEWTAAEVATFMANPYLFVIAGALPALQTLPTAPTAPATVSALPPTLLGGTDRPCADRTQLLTRLGNLGNPAQLQDNDTIILTPGVNYGPIVLPEKTSAGWIRLITADIASLPPRGTRVSLDPTVHRPHMFKFRRLQDTTHGTSRALIIPDRSFGWHIVGLDAGQPDTQATFGIVDTGGSAADGFRTQAQYLNGDIVRRIVMERCDLHGKADGTNLDSYCINLLLIRAIDFQIHDSLMTDAMSLNTSPDGPQESHGFLIKDSPGPSLVRNCFVQAAGQGGFGYHDDTFYTYGNIDIEGSWASDITVDRTHFFQPLRWNPADGSWDGHNHVGDRVIKQHLEFKMGRRVKVIGCRFENQWAAAQDALNGFTAEGSEDIEWVSNIHINIQRAHYIWGGQFERNFHKFNGRNNPSALCRRKRIWIHNNLYFMTYGMFIKWLGSSEDVAVEHNTLMLNPGGGDIVGLERFNDDYPQIRNLQRNNVFRFGGTGAFPAFTADGKGTGNVSDAAMEYDFRAPRRVWFMNALVSDNNRSQSEGWNPVEFPVFLNTTTAGLNEAGVQGATTPGSPGTLTDSSPLKGAGVDRAGVPVPGLDVGVNFPQLAADQAGTGGPPPPPDPPLLSGTPYHSGDTAVTGTGVISATIEVFIGGVSQGTAMVTIGGTWTKTVGALATGNVITATQTTNDGTSAASSPSTVLAGGTGIRRTFRASSVKV